MDLLSREQMEVLMSIASSESPLRAARAVRGRWLYILGLARAAKNGIPLDENFPAVLSDPDGYAERATAILNAVEEWMAEQPRRHVGDI